MDPVSWLVMASWLMNHGMATMRDQWANGPWSKAQAQAQATPGNEGY